MRRRNSPPSWRAKSQLKRAVWTPPKWRNPVGLGAKRTRGGTRLGYPRMIPGAHVSVTGGIHPAVDRAAAIGARAVQALTPPPRPRAPTNRAPANFTRFKERRAEAGIRGVVCHAVYLVNLAAPDDEIYEKSVAALVNTVEVGCAIEADGVVFHVGSHLGAGLDAGLERALPALRKALDRCTETTWLLIDRKSTRLNSSHLVIS